MKKTLAVMLLLIALTGIAAQPQNVNTYASESTEPPEEPISITEIEPIDSVSYTPIVSQAKRKTTPYIIVELKNITIQDDTDPFAGGEIEIGTLTMSGRGVPHILTWPIKVQDSSWQEANSGNTVIVNAPIFCEKENEMSDILAIIITAVDNDEIPEWISKFLNVWFEVGQTVAEAVGTYGPLLKGAMKLEEIGVQALLDYLSEAEQIGVHGQAYIPSDWQSGFLAVTEQADNMTVNYEIRRVEAPIRTPPVSVKLLNVTGIGGEGWGDGATDSEPFIHTRVLNNLTIPETLVQRHDFGPIGDVGDDTTWSINTEIFRAEAIGPFMHIEIDVWEEDTPSIGDDHDTVGIYSQTFYPDEHWGIGNTIVERRSGIDEGDVWIRFEITELPFRDVNVILAPTSLEVEPGYTGIFNVTVTNFGNLNDTYTLSLEGLAPSWYTFSNQTANLQPSQSTMVFLNVTPPRHWSTAPGDYEFTVTATSTHDPEATDSDYGTLTVLPFHEAQLFVVPSTFTAEPGETVTYTTGLQNLGNVRDDYNISTAFTDTDGMTIKPSWVTVWPLVFWGLDPGRTGTGLLTISVPEDWAISGLENATYTFVVSAVCQADPTATDEVTRELNVIVATRTLSITLSGEFDYAFKEPITIKISALVKDIKSKQPISGAHATIDIYAPNGDLLWSDQMTETITGSGLYIWESDESIQDIMKGPHWQPYKGVYTVIVEASYKTGPTAHEAMEFHIDPPAETSEPIPAYYIIALVAIVATSTILLMKLKPSFRKTKST